MKKLLITTIASASLLAVTATSYGQGQIQFQNSSANAPVTYGASAAGLGDTPGQRVFGPAGTFTYGLYLGPSGSTLFSQLTLVDTVASVNATSATFAAAGQFNGGLVTAGNANATFQITAGTTYAYEVFGWTSAAGHDFASALASGDPTGLFGSTGIGSITPTASPAGPAQAFVPSGALGGFTMNTVPEPTTIALGGLGAAALLFFRRRK